MQVSTTIPADWNRLARTPIDEVNGLPSKAVMQRARAAPLPTAALPQEWEKLDLGPVAEPVEPPEPVIEATAVEIPLEPLLRATAERGRASEATMRKGPARHDET